MTTSTPPQSAFEAPPGAKDAALAEEQRHLDAILDRVDVLRTRAEHRRAQMEADRSGSTFQARFERDVSAHHHAVRAARFTFGDVESLAFGRLDLNDGDTLHIGKTSVVDEAGDVLLVDWRAPAAAAFYRATMAEPLGVARRRTLTTRGRVVSDLDDEILDADAALARGLHAVTGQGALLAALTRDRRETMQDIVATIQADQDAIVRAPARGILIVTGGPGTGKTVVALHRVAYLLYEDRERFEGRGVLIVGPSPAFTEYTARVLPSLGEDRAVQRSLAALTPPGVQATGWDPADVGALKGDARMVDVCRRALADTMPPIAEDARISIDGVAARVSAAQVRALRGRYLARINADEPGRTYRELGEPAITALRRALWKTWRRAAADQHRQVPDDPQESGWFALFDAAPSMRMLLRSYWPDRTPTDVLRSFMSNAAMVERIVGTSMDLDAGKVLARHWASAASFTTDDAALLDEIDALLGTAPQATATREQEEGIRLISDTLTTERPRVDITAPSYRDFAHVVVDEAQDVTAMQWRSIARRGAFASWTIVGDLAQRSRSGPPATWDEVAALVGRSHRQVHELTVNYRTPEEIADVARAVLEDAGAPTGDLPSSVRRSGRRPTLDRVSDMDAALAAAVSELAATHEGTIGVIAPIERVGKRQAALASATDAARRRTRVFDPRSVKGLEFDDVIVTEPDIIARDGEMGMHNLYVAVTRATRSLTILAFPNAEVPAARALQEFPLGQRGTPG
ncbi:MAG: ATP-binding domain-containing protein [Nitriliruptoraceae bacterium]